METKIQLRDHTIYNWKKYGNVIARCGFMDIDFDRIAGELNDNQLAENVTKYNGNFSFVKEDDNFIFLGSDKYQSFPLL